jgi:heme exporter protein CcmD
MPNIELGKYAGYIWPPYVLSVVVIAALAADVVLRSRYWKRKVERLQAARERRKAR